MGVETIALVTTAVIGGVSAFEQRKAQRSAAKKEDEARDVARAEQEAQRISQTRQQIREERVRRAQILQQSENTGVGSSSGALGSVGALQTTVGSNLASATRQTNSADAITGLQQDAADFRSKAAQIGAIGSLAGKAVTAGAGIYAANQTPTAPTTQVGGQSPATEPNPYDLNNLFR